MKLKTIFIILLVVIGLFLINPVSADAATRDYIFNGEYYLNNYADLKAAYGTNYEAAWNHFITWGIDEGRSASISFDIKYYLASNEDIRENARKNAADVKERNRIAYNHFITIGVNEFRRTSPVFDVKYYINNNPDLKGMSNTEAYTHFATKGINEGRPTNAYFNIKYYLSVNSDLIRVFGPENYSRAYVHFLQFGMGEGRDTSSTFHVKDYINNYQDLNEMSYEEAFNHYITLGINENRDNTIGASSIPEEPVVPPSPVLTKIATFKLGTELSYDKNSITSLSSGIQVKNGTVGTVNFYKYSNTTINEFSFIDNSNGEIKYTFNTSNNWSTYKMIANVSTEEQFLIALYDNKNNTQTIRLSKDITASRINTPIGFSSDGTPVSGGRNLIIDGNDKNIDFGFQFGDGRLENITLMNLNVSINEQSLLAQVDGGHSGIAILAGKNITLDNVDVSIPSSFDADYDNKVYYGVYVSDQAGENITIKGCTITNNATVNIHENYNAWGVWLSKNVTLTSNTLISTKDTPLGIGATLSMNASNNVFQSGRTDRDVLIIGNISDFCTGGTYSNGETIAYSNWSSRLTRDILNLVNGLLGSQGAIKIKMLDQTDYTGFFVVKSLNE